MVLKNFIYRSEQVIIMKKYFLIIILLLVSISFAAHDNVPSNILNCRSVRCDFLLVSNTEKTVNPLRITGDSQVGSFRQ